jgi:hypothetical protein
MISLHAGRLLLSCERASQTWHAHIILGPKPEHQLVADTGTVDLRQAMERGQNLYTAFRAKARPVEVEMKVMCWDCIHWTPGGRGRCEMDIPESRQTGGRFAPSCAVFTPCKNPT